MTGVEGEHVLLPPHPSSVGDARRLVRGWLNAWGRSELVDSATLCVSELVTNAVVHAGTAIEVSVRGHRGGALVEVSDLSPHLPSVRNYGGLAGTGRGLHMVSLCCTGWGVRAEQSDGRSGKVVWFEVGTNPGSSTGRSSGPTPALAVEPADVVEVELLDVPLLLHAAWQLHAETQLREYLLARLDDDDGLEGLEAHAAASEAISVMAEQVRHPVHGTDVSLLLSVAVEPDVSLQRLLLRVPVRAVPHFAALDATLDQAIDLSLTGRIMTPPTQPELRGFRRWVCGQVRSQAEGAPAQAWDPEALAGVPDTRSAPVWDTTSIVADTRPVIAADDRSLILAVSPAAARLLGYGDPQHLTGRPVVDIIPHRLRQAHLAGFTLYLVTGRGPLVGSVTSVPFLRADGSEQMLELTLHAHTVAQARRVFVTELRAATA